MEMSTLINGRTGRDLREAARGVSGLGKEEDMVGKIQQSLLM
jgi:hypothetical protein